MACITRTTATVMGIKGEHRVAQRAHHLLVLSDSGRASPPSCSVTLIIKYTHTERTSQHVLFMRKLHIKILR